MTSHMGSQVGSHMGVANGTPTYGTYGTDGESGCEGANPSVPNARASTSPSSLAYATNCRYCGGSIFVAICSDGRWRSFETRTVPAAPTCVWAWRKRQGMQEQEHVPGKPLHFCTEYDRLDLGAFA